MKKLLAMLMVLTMMIICLPSALAATEYLGGLMYAEIDGVEYEFYQTKNSFAKSGSAFYYSCFDDNGKALFDLHLDFDDGIEVGEYCTDDSPYNRSGITVTLIEYFHEGGWSYDMYHASFHDLSESNPYVRDWDQERGYVWLSVDEEAYEEDGHYFYGSFAAAVVDNNDYGYEIYAGFAAEIA